MGRGRAKAKQTKVARDLKYRSMDTDFGALEREMHGSDPADDGPDNDVDYGAWSDYAEDSRE